MCQKLPQQGRSYFIPSKNNVIKVQTGVRVPISQQKKNQATVNLGQALFSRDAAAFPLNACSRDRKCAHTKEIHTVRVESFCPHLPNPRGFLAFPPWKPQLLWRLSFS